MDPNRIDLLARGLTSTGTRRGILAAVAASLVAALSSRGDAAAHRHNRRPDRRQHDTRDRLEAEGKKNKKKKKHKPRHGKPGQHTPAWRNQTTFGASGSGASQIISPAGLFVTDDGLTAFVAD
jgi:hypothetical protein